MKTMKIGVIADTHVPDIFPELPTRVLEVMNGVDIIFHAGDISSLIVLQQLEPIAQTFAVYGERDPIEVKQYLQDKQRLEFSGRAVGLVHGNRAWQGDVVRRVLHRFSRERRMNALYAHVLGEFEAVDVIVFGHSHEPYVRMHNSVMLFNPGSVVGKPGQPGTVGILEIGSNAIKGKIMAL